MAYRSLKYWELRYSTMRLSSPFHHGSMSLREVFPSTSLFGMRIIGKRNVAICVRDCMTFDKYCVCVSRLGTTISTLVYVSLGYFGGRALVFSGSQTLLDALNDSTSGWLNIVTQVHANMCCTSHRITTTEDLFVCVVPQTDHCVCLPVHCIPQQHSGVFDHHSLQPAREQVLQQRLGQLLGCGLSMASVDSCMC
jgi:hypothetical protein